VIVAPTKECVLVNVSTNVLVCPAKRTEGVKNFATVGVAGDTESVSVPEQMPVLVTHPATELVLVTPIGGAMVATLVTEVCARADCTGNKHVTNANAKAPPATRIARDTSSDQRALKTLVTRRHSPNTSLGYVFPERLSLTLVLKNYNLGRVQLRLRQNLIRYTSLHINGVCGCDIGWGVVQNVL
jgi:hypothetical protein